MNGRNGRRDWHVDMAPGSVPHVRPGWEAHDLALSCWCEPRVDRAEGETVVIHDAVKCYDGGEHRYTAWGKGTACYACSQARRSAPISTEQRITVLRLLGASRAKGS